MFPSSTWLPRGAVAAVAERTALVEPAPILAAVVHPDVAGAGAVVEAVGRDRAHDAAAEHEAQQAHGDELGGAVAGEPPNAAAGDRCRRRIRGGWCCGCFCRRGRRLLGSGLLLTRRGRCVGGQRGGCLVRCWPGRLRFVRCPISGRRLLRWKRLSLLAHVLNDAPFG